MRNALVRVVVDCAREHNAKNHRGPRSQGWRGAARKLGICIGSVQSVAWGLARHDTIARVQAALVAAGEMRPTAEKGGGRG